MPDGFRKPAKARNIDVIKYQSHLIEEQSKYILFLLKTIEDNIIDSSHKSTK